MVFASSTELSNPRSSRRVFVVYGYMGPLALLPSRIGSWDSVGMKEKLLFLSSDSLTGRKKEVLAAAVSVSHAHRQFPPFC